MPTLANINGASLSVDPYAFTNGLNSGARFGSILNREAQIKEDRDQYNQDRETIASGFDAAVNGDLETARQAFGNIAAINPQLAGMVGQIVQNKDTERLNKLKTETEYAAKQAALIRKTENPDARKQLLLVEAKRQADLKNDNAAMEAVRMANLAITDSDALNAELDQDILASDSFNTLFTFAGVGQEAKPETQLVDKVLYERQGDGSWAAVAGGGEGGNQSAIPPVLIQGLPEQVGAKVAAAYTAAGGGKDGIKAANEVKAIATEDNRRANVGKLIDQSFTDLDDAERQEIQAAVDSAETVAQGMEKAKEVRVEQQRLKKAQGFKERAVTLIKRIRGADELSDVLGGIEGSDAWYNVRVDQDEHNIIADIEEAQNILTAENLSLMSGVLSESDIQLLKNLASGALNRKRGEAEFLSDSEQLLNLLESADFDKGKGTKAASDRDSQAVAWAKKNPNDPRSARILKMNGQ